MGSPGDLLGFLYSQLQRPSRRNRKLRCNHNNLQESEQTSREASPKRRSGTRNLGVLDLEAAAVAAATARQIHNHHNHNHNHALPDDRMTLIPSSPTKAAMSRNPGMMTTNSSRTARSTRKFPLLNLPLDVLLHLTAVHLPASATVALKLTCRALYTSIRVPRHKLGEDARDDECSKAAIRFHVEEGAESPSSCRRRHRSQRRISGDAAVAHAGSREEGNVDADAKSTPTSLRNARMRCALCKALYPVSLFDRSGFVSLDVPGASTRLGRAGRNMHGDGEAGAEIEEEDEEEEDEFSRRGMLNVRNRVCKWHDGRFQRTVKGSRRGDHAGREEGERMTPREGWSLETACMHCGSVLAWARCRCNCQSCWRREVWCFTRVLEEEEERVREDAYLRWIF